MAIYKMFKHAASYFLSFIHETSYFTELNAFKLLQPIKSEMNPLDINMEK